MNNVRWCADSTEAVQLPWPTDNAPAFDAYWLQDMEESFDPTATEPPGAEVGPNSLRPADGAFHVPSVLCHLHTRSCLQAT